MTNLVLLAMLAENLPKDELLQDIFNRAGFHFLKRINEISASMLSLSDVFRSNKLSVIFAVDVMPLSSNGKVENPRIFNLHKILRKHCKRHGVCALLEGDFAAKFAIKLLSDSCLRQIYSQRGELATEYETDEEVIKVLQNGAYNKVEVIKLNGELAVRKTFRRWQSACASREIMARKELADIAEMSLLLDCGKYHITIPYYRIEYAWNEKGLAPYPVWRAKKVFAILYKIWQRGWALIDCHPGNFIFTDNGEIKIIDMEYACKYDTPSTFVESWDMAGSPQTILDSMPMAPISSYKDIWQPAIGMSYDSLSGCSDERTWLPYMYRTLFCSRRLISRNIRGRIIAKRQRSVSVVDNWICLSMKTKYR